jgi:hypothetical protein
MAVAFHNVTGGGLKGLDAAAPDGVVIGVMGGGGAGKSALLRFAAGLSKPESGAVESPAGARYVGPADELDLAPAPLLALEHVFALRDLETRERAGLALEGLRRAGSTVLLVSHEEELLRRFCDEIWWLHEGALAHRGHPEEILALYRKHVAERLRAWGETAPQPLNPRVRRGDGRAEILSLETLGENGRPTSVWRSGEPVSVKLRVRFAAAVEDPVVGILIRARTGLNVYGTNTELERLKFGPCAAGETVEIVYGFRCDLCPEEYALTAASHDPDGVWHDWLEDAVAFTVTDTRYTAGVANLRAQVRVVGRS